MSGTREFVVSYNLVGIFPQEVQPWIGPFPIS